MEEAAGKVKDIIEALTDVEVSEDYTGQSFPENPAGTIREYYYGGQQEGKDDDFAGSFYYFLFYFSKDGIKLDDLVFNFPLDDRVSYPKTVGINRKENTIYVRGEGPIEAVYAEDGLLYLNLPEVVEPLELYETVQVLSVEDMAGRLDSYFESQLGMPKATVTSMELKYDTAVSDPDEDGKVVEIIKPYWVVEYYDQRKTTSQGQKYYGWSKAVFDAQTGEFLKQASPVA